MSKSSRKRVVGVIGLLVGIACLLLLYNQRLEIAIACHRWRMNAAYDRLFANPEPVGNGLVAFDVPGEDVEKLVNQYEHHRQRLVELGAFVHLQASFPRLGATPANQENRAAFVQNMWDQFPGHKHYWLDSDGTLHVWDLMSHEKKWKTFFESMQKQYKSQPEQDDTVPQ